MTKKQKSKQALEHTLNLLMRELEEFDKRVFELIDIHDTILRNVEDIDSMIYAIENEMRCPSRSSEE